MTSSWILLKQIVLPIKEIKMINQIKALQSQNKLDGGKNLKNY